MNCFCGMVDQRKVFSLISSRDNCQRELNNKTNITKSKLKCQFRLWQKEWKLTWVELHNSELVLNQVLTQCLCVIDAKLASHLESLSN